LNVVLSADPEDQAAEIVVSRRASEFDINWASQLPVRLASCSAAFSPDALPIIENGQGILHGSLWGSGTPGGYRIPSAGPQSWPADHPARPARSG